ncbi:MAG: glycosyltransferase family 2 protein [Euryarchaeota archaeon]|nr:glycosyltransferase family 2 protein [Euryarchaeota archaeon]MBU4607062.1 glycosyltransferase family 2 protein [Euryarchaeota archaeon]MBV1728852.1 glycosyltransferase family 2 protein [Methanobacterium sp.]MBV1754835.1 glycosyltransferase family 2 protein [Methanobacterium sp.]
MDLTVVIPNYNGQPFLGKCLESLKNQDHPFDVIVIDNASQDESVSYIWENYPEFDLIENQENLGFAAAVNQGIKASNSEYIFLLNNDVQLEAETIYNLLKCIKKDENIFAVSSKIIQYHDPNKMDDAGDEYTILGWTRRVGYGKSPDKYVQEREIFSACAAASIYRRSILDEIGYFDENFFAYMEDVDLSYRARIHGYKCWYCPEAVVYHVGSGTSGSRYNEFKTRLAARNNVYVPYKNMPWPQLLVNLVFLCIGYFIKYLFFWRKGYGEIYLDGLKEGFKSRKKIGKVIYTRRNLKNYLVIQWILIRDTFKYLFY